MKSLLLSITLTLVTFSMTARGGGAGAPPAATTPTTTPAPEAAPAASATPAPVTTQQQNQSNDLYNVRLFDACIKEGKKSRSECDQEVRSPDRCSNARKDLADSAIQQSKEAKQDVKDMQDKIESLNDKAQSEMDKFQDKTQDIQKELVNLDKDHKKEQREAQKNHQSEKMSAEEQLRKMKKELATLKSQLPVLQAQVGIAESNYTAIQNANSMEMVKMKCMSVIRKVLKDNGYTNTIAGAVTSAERMKEYQESQWNSCVDTEEANADAQKGLGAAKVLEAQANVENINVDIKNLQAAIDSAMANSATTEQMFQKEQMETTSDYYQQKILLSDQMNQAQQSYQAKLSQINSLISDRKNTKFEAENRKGSEELNIKIQTLHDIGCCDGDNCPEEFDTEDTVDKKDLFSKDSLKYFSSLLTPLATGDSRAAQFIRALGGQ